MNARRLIVILAALATLAGGLVATVPATADAAGPPSVRVCARIGGDPYVGPMTVSNRNFWDFGAKRTLNSSPRGCMVFKGLQARRAYRVTVDRVFSSCNSGTRPDGTTYRWGSEGREVGASAWKVTKRTGTTNLGTFRVRRTWNAC
ncbi:hypothetical protein GOARA_030_00120 [Gordonia araii NBRC 100433]|uniref:Uncharacterized protein n=1 Tax=Gordonia araii NBRC 100433 TaxID=1073574 RepID=G7GZZ7_9ACTN|nr:hypothetical protein [Gordonia araii]NNG98351.1 hypothetical protein [Gordonia araii NBRC 100433]GAB09172.1 hypothetical protein GOARA_030_00120 [Gordonia araii NBRC 100433]